MTDIKGNQPIRESLAKGVSDRHRIYNEASELYSRLRTVGENFTRWETPDGRHHLLKLEGNQLVYTIYNQNSKPPQGKRIIYNCQIGANGELESISGKEYLHFKGGPKAKISLNTALIVQIDGFAKRIYGKKGATISWQDVIEGGLPKCKPAQCNYPSQVPNQTAPAETPAPTEPQAPQPPSPPETCAAEFKTVEGKLPARGKDFNEAWYNYAVKIPQNWVKDDDFHKHGLDIHPPEDKLTGFKFYNKPDGYTADQVVQNYINKLINEYGITDIKILDQMEEKGDPVSKSGKIITYKYKGREYKSVVQSQVSDQFGVLGTGSLRVAGMPLQAAFNPLLAPNPYLIQQLRESILKTLIVKTTPVENEPACAKIFTEIEKSFNPAYGTPPSGPPPQKIIIECPQPAPLKPKK